MEIKSLSFIVLIALTFAACESKSDQTTDTPETITIVDDGHNAENSLDYTGKYKGVLPCPDCKGIEVEIQLKDDNYYIYSTKYLGKGKEEVLTSTGTYEFAEDGKTIILDAISNRPNQFFVGENQLIELNYEGKRNTGDNAEKYILKK